MAEPTFVRVFRPADAQQVTEARIALEGSGIPFFIENEQFLGMTGLPFSFGHAETWVAVAEEDADDAAELLADWFHDDGEAAEVRTGDLPPSDAVIGPLGIIAGLLFSMPLGIVIGRWLNKRRPYPGPTIERD